MYRAAKICGSMVYKIFSLTSQSIWRGWCYQSDFTAEETRAHEGNVYSKFTQLSGRPGNCNNDNDSNNLIKIANIMEQQLICIVSLVQVVGYNTLNHI